MSPRNDDKGNYDDTEFPPDSENADNRQQPSGRPGTEHSSRARRAETADEGDYDDKDQ